MLQRLLCSFSAVGVFKKLPNLRVLLFLLLLNGGGIITTSAVRRSVEQTAASDGSRLEKKRCPNLSRFQVQLWRKICRFYYFISCNKKTLTVETTAVVGRFSSAGANFIIFKRRSAKARFI